MIRTGLKQIAGFSLLFLAFAGCGVDERTLGPEDRADAADGGSDADGRDRARGDEGAGPEAAVPDRNGPDAPGPDVPSADAPGPDAPGPDAPVGCGDTSNNTNNCGSCGHDCTALSHLATTTGVTCVAGACVVPPGACATGFAHCTANPDDGCETDVTTPAHCHSCTTQCSGPTPLCSASGCKSACPTDMPTPCGTTCANLDSDANHCGDCMTSCTQPASGGTSTCDARKCTLHCLGGYHACGNNCVSNATYCSGCTLCQLPPHGNGTQTCSTGGACDVSCNTGFHKCSGDCMSDTDASHCGPSCTMCGANQRCYQNGCKTPSCAGVACGGSDGAGGVCTDANGTCAMGRHCAGSSCVCDVPLTCGGASICGSWDFETGLEGWAIDPFFAGGSDGTAAVSTTAQHHGSGSRSLAVGSNGSYLDVGITLCGGNKADLSSYYHASAWLLLIPDANAPPLDRAADVTFHWFYGPNSQNYFETDVNQVPIGTWTRIVGNSPGPRTDIIRVNVELHATSSGNIWHGTFYLDEVKFSNLQQ